MLMEIKHCSHSHSLSFPSNLTDTFSSSPLAPASSPSVLSDLALCLSQSFFQLPISHTSTVNSLSDSSICVKSVIWPGRHLRAFTSWHDTQVTPWDTQMSTSDAMTHSLSLTHNHTQLTSNTHIDTHLHTDFYIRSNMSLFFIHLHTQKHFKDQKRLHTNASHRSNTLSVPFSFFSHTHTHSFFTPHIMPTVSETCSVFPLSAGPHTRQKTSLRRLWSLQTKYRWFSWTGQRTFVLLPLQYIGYYS